MNGYSRPVSSRVALSRSPYFFLFFAFAFSRVLLAPQWAKTKGEEEKRKKKEEGFSSLADGVLVGDYYMRVSEQEQAK